MNAAVYYEPYKLMPRATGGGIAGALALLVHLLFFSVLYFSFNWQKEPPQGMVVDIWEALPTDTQQPVPDAPPPPPPEQPPLQKPLPVPVAKVETAPVAPPKPDIELKSKKNKPREEKPRVENKAAQKLAEKQAEQAERRMEELERQAQAKSAAQRKAQAEAAAASGRVVDEYVAKISAKIRRWIVLPPGVPPNIEAKFNVTLLPGGDVLNATLVKPSGNAAYDSAVERAILKAQPLPLPPTEQNLFNRFRELHLKFSPAESGK